MLFKFCVVYPFAKSCELAATKFLRSKCVVIRNIMVCQQCASQCAVLGGFFGYAPENPSCGALVSLPLSGVCTVLQFALRHILEPMAWAKAPFEKRAASITCPLTFIYGENDWMDPEAGQRICDVLRKSHSEVPTAKKLRPRQNECLVIKNSGHHTYLESPDEFNKILLEIAVP